MLRRDEAPAGRGFVVFKFLYVPNVALYQAKLHPVFFGDLSQGVPKQSQFG